MTNVFRVSRNEIPGRTTMEVEGELQTLGIVKNFKGDARLAAALPRELAISWTHLDPGQELDAHWHDVPSMVIVCHGEGRSTGDTEAQLGTGDVVCVPAWNLHGFAGAQDQGFWALSVQFQETAIFESEDQPYTTYMPPADELPSAAERALKIVGRYDLPEINEAVVNGVRHDLGRVRNFRASPVLDTVLPETLSLAWVYLAPGQTLAAHVHETDSMILVTQGEGRVFGDLQDGLTEGDAVFVPAGCQHGFTGAGEHGFWALSIQFEPTSLYEDPQDPKVAFVPTADLDAVEQPAAAPSLARLMAKNADYAAAFAKNPVFALLQDGGLDQEPVRKRFCGALRSWSDHFQRLMHARYAFTRDPGYAFVFLDHLLDELGHNEDLAKDDGALWDPTLDALGAWFTSQSLTLDNADITCLVHMVLERGATVFYPKFFEAFGCEPADQVHFEKHLEVDCEHERMGVELLAGLRPQDYARLEGVLEQGWGVLDALIARVATLANQARVQNPQARPWRQSHRIGSTTVASLAS